MNDLRTDPREPRRGRSRPALVVLEVFLWVSSLVALVSVALILLDSALYQQRGASQLESSAQVDGDASALVEHSEVPPPTVGRAAIPLGTPLATIEIPRLGIEAVIAEGDSTTVLRRAVGHLPATARPGEAGNIALAGHRDTFFRGLGAIEVGDTIVLLSAASRDLYVVEWTEVVLPHRVDVLQPTEAATLTLITCYPFRWIGLAPKRFVVRARRIETEQQTAALEIAEPAGEARACGAGRFSVRAC